MKMQRQYEKKTCDLGKHIRASWLQKDSYLGLDIDIGNYCSNTFLDQNS